MKYPCTNIGTAQLEFYHRYLATQRHTFSCDAKYVTKEAYFTFFTNNESAYKSSIEMQ